MSFPYSARVSYVSPALNSATTNASGSNGAFTTGTLIESGSWMRASLAFYVTSARSEVLAYVLDGKENDEWISHQAIYITSGSYGRRDSINIFSAFTGSASGSNYEVAPVRNIVIYK